MISAWATKLGLSEASVMRIIKRQALKRAVRKGIDLAAGQHHQRDEHQAAEPTSSPR